MAPRGASIIREEAVTMKLALGIEGLRLAWAVITAGQRIVSFAQRLEERAIEPYTWRCNLAWRLMSVGERVVSLGETLEARVYLWARRAGCDCDALLASMVEPYNGN
jgi:hypothetical protein